MGMAKQYLTGLLERFSDNRYLCVRELLAGNAIASQKIGLKIYEKHPQYLLLSLYMDMPRSKPLLLHFLKKMSTIEPMFLYTLINSEYFETTDLQQFISAVSKEGFMNAVIERDWFLKGGNLGLSFSNCSKSEILIKLLDRIDDFRLYKYALEHCIDIPERNTANYKWYLVHRDKNKACAADLILKTSNFHDVHKLCSLSGVRDVCAENYDILIKYLMDGYSEDLLKQAATLFISSESFLNCKIFLALLIASKNENNLVLALYISYSTKFSDNYEIDLLHLFLNRYFCFHKNIPKLMKKMSIKNIQLYNNAYIWTDPMIVCSASGQYLPYISELKPMHQRDLGLIESKISTFLESGLIGHAVSLVKLYEELRSVLCAEEVAHFKILATEEKTMYSGLLGEQCDYLFNKVTVNNNCAEKACIGTLYSHADGSSYKSVLENPFIKITCPKFLYEFADLASLR